MPQRDARGPRAAGVCCPDFICMLKLGAYPSQQRVLKSQCSDTDAPATFKVPSRVDTTSLPPEKMKAAGTLLTFGILFGGTLGGPWSAWMPQTIVAFEGTCVAIPCRFDYPDELRPSAVHGIWYFNSPYPRNYPPVVYKSRTSIVHESFQGRTRLLGDLQARNCTLQLGRLSPELAGKYFFRGDLGGYNQYTYSEHSNLEIINKPTIVPPAAVVVGTEAELRCVVPDNCPTMKPVVSWLHHEVLEEQAVFGQLEEESGTWSQVSLLKFRPSRENDGHELGCQVTYPNTTFLFEAFATLDVKYVPRILQVNSSLEITEGSHVVLACVVDSNPLALLAWFKEEAVLREEPSTNLTLELDNVTHAHDGIYTCSSHGGARSQDSWFWLCGSLADAPRKPSVNSSVVAVEGEPVTILCTTESNPEPIITIFKEKQIVATVVYESELLLEIPAVTHEDDGEYWCVAENQYGQRGSAFNLTVEFAPIILVESKCTAARDTVQCVCAVLANPEPVISFELPTRNVTVNETDQEFVYSQKTGYTVTSILTLRGEPDSQLFIVCSARNLYGTKNQQLQFHHSIWGISHELILIKDGWKNVNENSSFVQLEHPPMAYSGEYRPPAALDKSEYERRLASDKHLLNKPEGSLDLNVDYANIDFTKLATKDSYTLTEELAEYAEIRVK
ncbi:Myelin-associated glycoprotein [Chelonia mydas]|uniref:Myelin-associated glycoprotein n=1 Tax=Chelonia mydas TaxID=8469 RepID=M7APV2_CHEMY|nr:Myelin-associated glycoprotein [Chelonia mydas]